MEYQTSRRKISKSLEIMRSSYSDSSRVSEISKTVSLFLLYSLPNSIRVEDSNIIFDCIEKYVQSDPISFLIPLGPYFSHGLNKHKPVILNLLKKYFFQNPDILKQTVFPLILSTLSAVSESNDISAQATEIIDQVSTNKRIHDCIWKVLLINSKARLPALNYLTYRLVVGDKMLALHGLVTCLNDPSIPVRKNALVLIKRIFPFDSEEIDRDIKKVLLSKIIMLFIQNDKNLVGRAIEWVQDMENSLAHDGVIIIAESLLEIFSRVKQAEVMLIHNNFLTELVDYHKILQNILVPLALNFYGEDLNLPEFYRGLIKTNKVLFWTEYKKKFVESLNDPSESPLFGLYERLIVADRDQCEIDFFVRALINDSSENCERNLRFCIRLLEYTKKTNIGIQELETFSNRSPAGWELKVLVLIQFHSLSVSCDSLIEQIINDNIESNEDRIQSIEFTLENIPDKISADDIDFVFDYSLETENIELLSTIIHRTGKKVNKPLKYLLYDYPNFALECLILSNELGFKYKSSIIISIARLFVKDDDYMTTFLAIKWLNQVIQKRIDIFSHFCKYLSSDKKTEFKSKEILESLKNLIRFGRWPVIKLMIHFTEKKILLSIEQFIIKPPNNLNLRILSCELSSLIVLNSSSDLSLPLVNACLNILGGAINNKEKSVLLVLIEFFDNLLISLIFEAENEIKGEGLVNILDPLTKLIGFKNKIVRNGWLDFIKRLIPFMLKYLDHSTSLSYLNNIMKTYLVILGQNFDSMILYSLKYATEQLLYLPELSDVSLVKTSKKLLYMFLQKYFDLATSSNEIQKSVSRKLLKRIFIENPQKFIKKTILMWVEDCLYNSETWELLERYIDIIAGFQTDLFEVIKKTRMIFCKKIEVSQENNEKFLIISCIFTKLHEKLRTRSQETWSEAILVYNKMLQIKLPEIHFFITYSLYLLKQQIEWSGICRDDQISLSEIVKECIRVTLSSTQSSIIAYKLPYPLINEEDSVNISDLYFALINKCLHEVVDIGK